MLYRSLIRRVLTLHLAHSTVKPFSSSVAAMAVPSSSFKLDRSIFNSTLYSHLRDFWFSPLPEGASAATDDCNKIWFGVNQSKEDKAAFDEECRSNYGHALEAIGPEKLALPPFESYEVDIENAADLAKPFLDDVKNAQANDERQGADMLLSFMILLDQMPRNLYRNPAGLRLVFRHYDRLSFSLLHASLGLKPNPLNAECYKLRPAVKQFYLIPFMHCEHLPSHQRYVDIFTRIKEEVEAAGGEQEAISQMQQTLNFENLHFDILRRFGRYPHRNLALGRTSTKEEEEYLKTGQTFGTAQTSAEDEGKSEL